MRLKFFSDFLSLLPIENWQLSEIWDERNPKAIPLEFCADHRFAGAQNFGSEQTSYSLAGRHIQIPMRSGLEDTLHRGIHGGFI